MTKRTVLIEKGLPASGKSTHALALLGKRSTYKRVSRDPLREMADGGVHSEAKEREIRKAELALAEVFYSSGYNLVVDDCNLSPSAQSIWQTFAETKGVPLQVQDFTHVSVEECIERDRKRPKYVGEKAIRDMYYRYLYKPPVPLVYNPSLPDACLIDIDGTLALHNGRNPYEEEKCDQDLPNEQVMGIARHYRKQGIALIVVSGRHEKVREKTLAWLFSHDIIPAQLLMRADGDQRADTIIKREIFDQHVNRKYNVLFCLDDRSRIARVWRELGLLCLQVAEGDF